MVDMHGTVDERAPSITLENEDEEANEGKDPSVEKVDKGYESSESQQKVLCINSHKIEPCPHARLDEHYSFIHAELSGLRIPE